MFVKTTFPFSAAHHHPHHPRSTLPKPLFEKMVKHVLHRCTPQMVFEVLYIDVYCTTAVAAEDSKLEPEMMVFVCGHRRDIPDDVSWLSWA